MRAVPVSAPFRRTPPVQQSHTSVQQNQLFRGEAQTVNTSNCSTRHVVWSVQKTTGLPLPDGAERRWEPTNNLLVHRNTVAPLFGFFVSINSTHRFRPIGSQEAGGLKVTPHHCGQSYITVTAVPPEGTTHAGQDAAEQWACQRCNPNSGGRRRICVFLHL